MTKPKVKKAVPAEKKQPLAPTKPSNGRTKLSNADNLRALNNAITSLKKRYGEDTIIDVNNLPDMDSISTGSLLLDSEIGIGGLPCGRVVEIYGDPSSGKTSLCTLLAASAQAKDPNAYVGFVDVEHALDPDYAVKLGLNMDMTLFTQPGSAEEALDTVLSLAKSGACSLIILDSIGGLQTKLQLEKGMGEATMAEVARILSQNMSKIVVAAKETGTLVVFVNQVRSTMNMYGPSEVTMGGKALKFFASVRLEVKRVDILTEGEAAIGQTVRIKVMKNKVGPPFGKIEADLFFGIGFDLQMEIIELAIRKGIIKQGGAWFSIEGGEAFQGRSKLADHLKDNPDDFFAIKDKLFSKTGA